MTKKFRIRLYFFALCLIFGVVFGVMSNIFDDVMPIKVFSKTLHFKEKIAEKNIQIIKKQIVEKENNFDFENIKLKKFENRDIFYYVIENNELIYWSDNQLDIKNLDFENLQNNTFAELPNASCLLKIYTEKNLKFLAAIKIKNNYGVNNDFVENDFAKGFLIDKSVEINFSQQNEGAVYNSQGDYVFSLAETEDAHHNKILFQLHIFFIFLALVFYGLLYYNLNDFFGEKVLRLKNFLLATTVFIGLPLILLFLKIPPIFFKHRIFSPVLLYFNIMPSIGHLLITALLVSFAVFTFYYKVSIKIKHKFWFLGVFFCFFPAFFMLIIKIIHNIIYNSTLEIFTFPPQNNEIYSVITLSIVVLWFLVFCFAYKKFSINIHKFMRNKFIFLINIVCSLLFCLILFLFKNENFLLLSAAYFTLTSLLFLFINILKNAFPLLFLSIICYFFSIFIVYYTLENQQNNQYKNAEVVADNLVLEEDNISSDFLYKDSVSNGYFDKIFDKKTNNSSQKFSSALYKKNNLIYKYGSFSYPIKYNFKITNLKNNSTNSTNYIHYIFAEDDDLQIVVSCEQMSLNNTFILNLTYIVVIFLFFILLIKLFFKQKNLREGKSITDNLQKSFIYIIALSLSIVVLSIIYFIYREHQEAQKSDLETKMKYILTDINNYFVLKNQNFDDDLHNYDTTFFNSAKLFSHKYEVDIHIYSVNGELLATSCPYVFKNGFMSNLINTEYFFEKPQINTIKIENIGSLKYHSIYSAIFDKNKNIAAYLEVPMFFSMQQLHSETILYIAVIANIFFLILIASILLNFWLSMRITLSISKIEKSLKNIAVGGKNLKMEIKQSEKMDEIEKLMLQYNIMVDELEKNTTILLENERNFAWRDMAKQIAHEIKNPLTPMKLSIQQLQRVKKMKPEEFDKYFDKMSNILIEQIDNLSKIASSFSNFAKIQTENFEKIDITQKLFSTVELFKNNTKNVEIIYEKPLEPIFVTTDSEQILEVFNNIFKNAIQAIPSGRKGKINVSSTLNGANVLIVISDNGCGISEEDGKSVFMPNFSTKSSGTGLGLSIAKHIIEASNGKIWFNSKENHGTEFFIELRVEE